MENEYRRRPVSGLRGAAAPAIKWEETHASRGRAARQRWVERKAKPWRRVAVNR